MFQIKVSKHHASLFDENQLRKVYQQSFKVLEKERVDITLVIEDDTFISDLNKTYRGQNKPTDVLSFNLDQIDPETGRHYLGDIIISIETAKRQAAARSAPLIEELSLLLVHGILHLLGFDHDDKNSRERMWQKQREILQSSGIRFEDVYADEKEMD